MRFLADYLNSMDRTKANSKEEFHVLITTVPQQAGGGISTLHRILFSQKAEMGFQFVPLEVSSRSPWSESLTGRFARISFCNALFVLLLIKDNLARIVHINTAPDTKALLRDVPLILIAKSLGRKVVVQIHGGLSDYNTPWAINRIAIHAFNLCDRILVFSKKDMNELRPKIPTEKICVFPNAVNVKEIVSIDGNLRKNLLIPEENKIVLFISRFIKEKGVFDFIESIPNVLRDFRKVTFVFVGDGPEMGEMQKRCSSMALKDCIRFTGYLDYEDTLRAFRSADIFVLPSHSEAMPISILQALAAGLPIISTHVGAIPEILREGVNCLFAESKNPANLEKSLRILLKNDAIRQQMKASNVKLAREEFDVTVVLGKLGKLYNDLLN